MALSNDGWFGSIHQPYQHIMGFVLPAVESRMPLVHVANNGPSVVITPHGKVIFSSPFQRQGVYVTDVPVASKTETSSYSGYPHLFIYGLYSALILTFLNTLINLVFLRP